MKNARGRIDVDCIAALFLSGWPFSIRQMDSGLCDENTQHTSTYSVKQDSSELKIDDA